MKNDPPWSASVIYQIYPRSFQDSNSDGIGDLLGIISKLDYLQSLGIDAIWISPFYPSPMKDFGYDITDYCNIDPLFGNMENFETLIDKAHSKNIKVLIDYVPSHTSTQHPWFLEAKSSKDNPKRDWYIWNDPKPDGSPPNNWLSVFGGSAWEYDNTTRQYYFHSFIKEQADLNWRNPEVEKIMLDVIRFWMEKGVDGIRIDAFGYIYKRADRIDEPLITNPLFADPYFTLDHIYTQNQPELYPLIKKISRLLQTYKNRFFITEFWHIPVTQVIALYQAGDTTHAPFNFTLIDSPWNAQTYKAHIDEYDSAVGSNHTPTYVLGNHDRHRIATRIGEKCARVAAMLLLTLRGIPTLYYGDEIGMKDVVIPKEMIHDPFEKNVPGKGLGRDPQRTPMQWNEDTNAGFSTHQPWLPVEKDYKTVNVSTESIQPSSMLSLYKSLLTLRREYEALHAGAYIPLPLTNTSVLMYYRKKETETILICLNFSTKEQSVLLPEGEKTLLLSTYMDDHMQITEDSFRLRPSEGCIFLIQN